MRCEGKEAPGAAVELISNAEKATRRKCTEQKWQGQASKCSEKKGKEVNRKAVEKWEEKRLKRMDAALTKIDEVIEETKMLDGLPQLILKASEIKHEETRKEAAKTLVYVWSALKGRLEKIDALVNEGMTVPEEKDE